MMSDCQFPDQCGFPNCFCVGEVEKKAIAEERAKRDKRNSVVITVATMVIIMIVNMAI